MDCPSRFNLQMNFSFVTTQVFLFCSDAFLVSLGLTSIQLPRLERMVSPVSSVIRSLSP